MNTDEMKTSILELMSAPEYMPMRKRGLAKALDISDEDYREFRHLLETLAESGEISELRRGKFGLPLSDNGHESRHTSATDSDDEETSEADGAESSDDERKKVRAPKGTVIGRIEVKRGGMGFLLSEPPGNDIFIAEGDLAGALTGDLVAVITKKRVERTGRRGKFGGGGYGGAGGSRPAGRVVKILERGRPKIVGTYHAHRTDASFRNAPGGYVIPDARGIFTELDVMPTDRNHAKHGDKVAVELVETAEVFKSGHRPLARVIEVFGPAGEPDADTRAIVENFNVRTKFPDKVLAQAEALPAEVPASDLIGRTDYTQPVTFTIDPADAKDHDDAVALRPEGDGRTTLLVHIADVSHYVKENDDIDLEARERATSVYLPGSVYPMLPQKLSNNLCSLKQDQLRLTKTISMTFSPALTLEAIKIERSYIRSAAFLTYDTVKEAVEQEKPDLVRSPEIYESLLLMRTFADGLRKKRLATGSLDLELPEVKLKLNEQNEVIGFGKVEHHWAHELIEDMMLAANRAVAMYLVEHEIPGLFRIHEDPNPEALERFIEFVQDFGISLRPPLDRLKIKSVLDRVRGKDYAHTIHLALLTSLKQAKYSAECLPHFALNFARYLHFTSPIRRYPDLIVHRALDSHFLPGQAALPAHGKKRGGGEAGRSYHQRISFLRPLAAHCSLREREAAAAEEEVKKFRQMEYLRRNMKESHPGLITSVREFGLFVELQDCFVEGLVHVEDIGDDYYEYFENQHLLQGRRNQRSFRLGDKVTVKITHIDLGKKQVNLELV
jgi:ribonuclease R